MSQLKVNTIRHTGATTDAITLAADGTCTAKLSNAGINRNLIINGAMEIQQRTSTNSTAVTDGYSEIDRFHIWANPASKLTYEQDTEAPVGFSNSLKITSTSAYTPTSGNYFYVGQKIEGNNWKHLEYGTSDAKTCTISFWARSSITGTWSGIIKNDGQDRSYPWEYTISSANTWEKKSVTIPGCPDGTWVSGIGAGAWIYFCIGSSSSGTTYLGSANSWQSSNLIGSTGSNSLVNTNAATLYITGLQVELGDVATDFEYRLYSDELARCQRYFFNIKGDDNDSAGILGHALDNSDIRFAIDFPVPMRELPNYTGNANDAKFKANNVSSNFHLTNLSMINAHTTPNPSRSMMKCVTGSSLSVTGGECGDLEFHEDGGELQFSAEL